MKKSFKKIWIFQKFFISLQRENKTSSLRILKKQKKEAYSKTN